MTMVTKTKSNGSNLTGEAIDDEAPPPPPPALSPPSPNRRSPTDVSSSSFTDASAAASTSSSSSLTAASRHRRSVSGISDLSVDTPTAPGESKAVADILEQVSTGNKLETPSRGVQRQLTLADVKGASPMEEEAHTILLEALDEKEINLEEGK